MFTDNIAAKQKSDKLKAKLAERKEKRALEAKLAKVKRLADDSDDESAAVWVKKNRKMTEERLKAEKKVRLQTFYTMIKDQTCVLIITFYYI